MKHYVGTLNIRKGLVTFYLNFQRKGNFSSNPAFCAWYSERLLTHAFMRPFGTFGFL